MKLSTTGRKIVFSSAILVLFLILPPSLCSPATKVKELGPKLPEFIEEHPDKSWLIKFHVQWCYQCTQLEVTFNNVAEKIYNKHDNLVVGEVDCNDYRDVCERYTGPRTEEAITDFAERLNGPEVRTINDCNHLNEVANRHGYIVLSTEKDLNTPTYQVFKTLASSLRIYYWFYHYDKKCKNLANEENNYYIVKKDLDRSIKFTPPKLEIKDFKDVMSKWIHSESFPVYGELNAVNEKRYMASKKMLVIAVLEEYKKKFNLTSREYHKYFGDIAKRMSQKDNSILFTWTSDLNIAESIALRKIQLPNVMLLKSNYKYRLLIPNETAIKENVIPDILKEKSIKQYIEYASVNDEAFEGGDSLFLNLYRFVYRHYRMMRNAYQHDRLLASILMLLPMALLMFIFYQTCLVENYDDLDDDLPTDDGGQPPRDPQRILNHDKQD